jgi:hypothetical protein
MYMSVRRSMEGEWRNDITYSHLLDIDTYTSVYTCILPYTIIIKTIINTINI